MNSTQKLLVILIAAMLVYLMSSCQTLPDRILIEASNCPNTEVVVSKYAPVWDYSVDNTQLLNAREGCRKLYTASPCLARFEKRGELNYWATCGREVGK